MARFLGRAGMVYSPTVIVAEHGKGSVEYFRAQHDLSADTKYQRFAPHPRQRPPVTPPASALVASRRPPEPRRPGVDPLEFSFPIVAEGLADVIRAGGRGAIGEHGEQNGIGSHWEIWSYAAALTPMEALRIATLDGAYFLGLDEELGSIREGKLADLLVLNSDPRDDIRNTGDILYVMKNGRLHDGETLDEI